MNLPAKKSEVKDNLRRESAGALPILGCNHGAWALDGIDVPDGTEFWMNVDFRQSTWVLWKNSKPTERVGGFPAAGYTMPDRSELEPGNTEDDQKFWELRDGKRQDPWSPEFSVPMENAETGEWVVFRSSAWGALKALRRVSMQYSNCDKGNPRVTLGKRTRFDKKRSTNIIEPDFTIVGWEKEDGHNSAAAAFLPPKDDGFGPPPDPNDYGADLNDDLESA